MNREEREARVARDDGHPDTEVAAPESRKPGSYGAYHEDHHCKYIKTDKTTTETRWKSQLRGMVPCLHCVLDDRDPGGYPTDTEGPSAV